MRSAALVERRPELRKRQPYKAILERDVETLSKEVPKEVAIRVLLEAHGGIGPDEFDRISREWLASARHPRFNRPFADLGYRPMLELMGYLRALDEARARGRTVVSMKGDWNRKFPLERYRENPIRMPIRSRMIQAARSFDIGRRPCL